MAVVHDQERVPAVRRLHMTVTARVWEAEGGVPRLIASMDEDSKIFGPVAYKLKLSTAIRRGIIAPYQVLCLDIRVRVPRGICSDSSASLDSATATPPPPAGRPNSPPSGTAPTTS